jgi:hypothetical protein
VIIRQDQEKKDVEEQPSDDFEPECGIRQDQEKKDIEEVAPSLNNEDDVEADPETIEEVSRSQRRLNNDEDDVKADPETIEEVPRIQRRRRGPHSVKLPDGTEYVLISQRSPENQLRSAPFLLLCVYFAIQMLVKLWTLTTAHYFLAYLGDDEYNNRYLTIFTLLTPVSIIGVPFVDATLQKFGYHGGMQAVSILAILQGIIKVSIDNLNVQIV